MSHLLSLDQIDCFYGPQKVVSSLSLSLEAGEIGCLLGASGCGKTTVLRAIAGFEPITAGSISLREQTLSTPGQTLAPEKRQIGMVFQDYALFPTMTVEENIRFGLNKLTKVEQQERVDAMLDLTHMLPLRHRYPHEISGGQQQRVALARALAPKPSLVLLDEPFSNLDTKLRTQLARDVYQILKHEGTSALLVTHDQEEAYCVADSIGVMHKGQIQQWDTADQIFHHPNTKYVAEFVGSGLFLPGKIHEENHVDCELGLLPAHTKLPNDTPVDVLIRPEHIQVYSQAPIPSQNGTVESIPGTVRDILFLGRHWLFEIQLASGTFLKAYLSYKDKHLPNIGECCWVRHCQAETITFSHS